MSLLYWLPLRGNLKNIGTAAPPNDFLSTNITYETSGRIGDCAYFDGTSRLYHETLTIGNTWSLGMWIKADTGHSGWETIGILHNTGSNGDMQFGLYWSASDNRVEYTANTSYASTNLNMKPAGEWNHICQTYDGTTSKLFINGELVGNKTVTHAIVERHRMDIGARYAGPDTALQYPFYGCMNDIRIYDHCLSDKEVELWSRSLAIHYPLYYGTNLVPTDLSKWNKESAMVVTNDDDGFHITRSSTTSASRWGIFLNLSNIESDTKYTFSADMKTGAGTSTRGVGISIADNPVAQGSSAYGTTRCSTINTEYTHIHATITTQTANNGTIRIYLFGMNDANAAMEYWVRNIRVTKSGMEYTIAQDDIMYDCSGYENNGVIHGGITISDNPISPRYGSCLYFPGVLNQSYITCPFYNVHRDKYYTLNVWFYKTALSTCSWDTIFGSHTPGYELEMKNSSGGSNPRIGLYSWGADYTTEYTFNEWHMLSFAQDDTNVYVYLDGELKLTNNKAKTDVNTTYYLGAWATRQNYLGWMSDFRIYTTCLSQAAITDLYQTSMAIDNNGNVIPRVLTA